MFISLLKQSWLHKLTGDLDLKAIKYVSTGAHQMGSWFPQTSSLQLRFRFFALHWVPITLCSHGVKNNFTRADSVFSFAIFLLLNRQEMETNRRLKDRFDKHLWPEKPNANISKPTIACERFLTNYIITSLFRDQHRFDGMRDKGLNVA